MAGLAVAQCLDDEAGLKGCYLKHMGDSVQRAWSDQNCDPEEDFLFYADVVAYTEDETGIDYGEMTQDSLGFMSTDAQRTINRALAEAPDVYDRCFTDSLP